MRLWFLLLVLVIPGVVVAQAKGPAQKGPAKTLQAQSFSSINATTAADGSQTVEIQNVTYEITGTGLQQKPIYMLTQAGTDGNTLYPDLFVTDRRLEEVQWWSVHKLGSGQHLFDTYVPVLSFSISREVLTTRYAGLEVPPDDAKDARLKEPHVVGVITYASADHVIREALLTSDDPTQAKLL